LLSYRMADRPVMDGLAGRQAAVRRPLDLLTLEQRPACDFSTWAFLAFSLTASWSVGCWPAAVLAVRLGLLVRLRRTHSGPPR